MLEKPRLKDDNIIACLKTSYGLTATKLEFLPLGYDSNAGVYRVQAGGQDFFLKVKRNTVYELSMTLPRYLKAHGIEQVIPPLPTITQELWGTVDGFNLILYPFIEAGESNLSDEQWIEFGGILKRLHTIQLPPDLLNQIPKETFVPHPKWFETVHQLQAVIDAGDHDNPYKKELAAYWKSQQHEINAIVARTDQLSRMLHNKPLNFALCHSDIHIWNLLLDRQGNLFVVDWDQPILAPIERDLMFVTVGGFVTDARYENLFFQGYGETVIDPLVMAYYRYERTLEDLVEFAMDVFLRDTSDETKADSMKWLKAQFDLGNAVESAHKLDYVL